MSDTLCRQQASQLVIIDIQEKLGGAMPDKVLNRVLKNTVMLIDAAGRLDIPVTVTEQYPKGLGPTCSQITAALPKNASRIEKTDFSCAHVKEFRDVTANADRLQLILAGMEAHICVLQSALDLRSDGLQVIVVEDAICSRRLENYESAINRLRHAGVIVTNSESVIFEWLRGARHEHFKAVSALVR